MFASEVYLERGRKEGEKRGIEQGIEQGKTAMAQINKLYIKENKLIADIAKELKITTEEVRTALIELGYDLDKRN